MTKVNEIYPDKWLRVKDLKGKRVVVTVDNVAVEALRQVDGSTRRKVVLGFVGAKKRLPLNKTQAYAVAEIAGSEEVEDWVGVRLALRPGRAQNGRETIVIERPKSNVQSTMSDVQRPMPEEE